VLCRYWALLIDYVRRNPEAKVLFTDKGSAEVPVAFLLAVEVGLRTFAQNESTAMGKYAMDSLKEWVAVPIYKKCEAYIAVCRYILDLPEYLKYIGYDFADFISRRHMRETFMARHLQYTNGSKKVRGLSDPASWTNASSRRRKHVYVRRRSKKNVPPPTPKSASPATDEGNKYWDSEEEAWMSIEE
jgi:hypothetical protein